MAADYKSSILDERGNFDATYCDLSLACALARFCSIIKLRDRQALHQFVNKNFTKFMIIARPGHAP